jgi:site-specific DNA recombinase
MEPSKPRVRRCAIYTRKSSEEGLEQAFNSLQAQREACEAFVQSQRGEGWRLIKTHYDDGGLSGATMGRPALQRLMQAIEQGLVDAVVVYKVDRLTRSLADFARLVELFDSRGVSFVAVTQQFNTTTSMGRLTLNVLLSFAQFEREVTGERIRDKIAASKRKGMWMGGYPPLGYDVRDRQLIVNASEAETVRQIFARYLELGNVRLLKAELDRTGVRSKRRASRSGCESGGQSFSRGALYKLLGNPIYIGEIRHKATSYPGQHAAIIDRETWVRIVHQLGQHSSRSRVRAAGSTQSLLAGKLFDEHGEGLTPSHTKKGERRYRYYVSRALMKGDAAAVQGGWRVPAAELERIVAMAITRILGDQRLIVTALEPSGLDTAQLAGILDTARRLREQLQADPEAGVQLSTLIERVELKPERLRITLKLPVTIAGAPHSAGIVITHELPLQLRRRGIEQRLIIPGETQVCARVDQTLLKAVARAHCWLADLISGEATSMAAIAARAGVSKRYVSRLVRLALLAPELVERIVEGRQAPELSAQSLLTDQFAVPPSWQAQRRTFGLVPEA